MIWQESTTNIIYQGQSPIQDLSPLERNLLLYFLENPGINLTKSELIENSWPFDVQREGVSDDSLFRLIRSLRSKLRNDANQHSKYIINWRGLPEGGYLFNPSGQTASNNHKAIELESPSNILNQLTVLQQIITQQKQTIILLEEIVDSFVEKVNEPNLP